MLKKGVCDLLLRVDPCSLIESFTKTALVHMCLARAVYSSRVLHQNCYSSHVYDLLIREGPYSHTVVHMSVTHMCMT